MKRQYAIIFAICIFALAIKATNFIGPIKLDNDGRVRYDPEARNLLAGRGFSTSITAPYLPDSSEHNPGYAFFLAGSYFISNHNLRFVAFLQMILELSTVYLVWLISGLLGLTDRTRRFAVAIGLLCPLLPRYTREVLTEVLATFAITLALYLVLLSIKRNRAIFWIAAGFGCAFSWFVRADLLPVIILLVLSSAALTRKIAKPALLVVTLFLAVSPWIIRNYQLSGNLMPVADLNEKNGPPYVQWINSWITEMDDHNRYVHKTKPDPKIDYAKLAEREKSKGPVRTYFVVPLLRLFNVLKDDLDHDLFRGFKWIPLHVLAYGTVILGALGIAITVYRRKWILLPPICVIAGRLILPCMSALAMHFRLLVEMMPVQYIFAGIAANVIYTGVSNALFGKRARRFSAQENPISSDTSEVW